MKDYSKENLDVTHYRNGDPIPFVKSEKKWSKLTTGAYCYYDDDPEKGILYNWYAVNDSRGLAPEGWKIPTIEELEQIDLTTGLPGGYRNSFGYYATIGDCGYWWSSTEYSTSNAWNRVFCNFNGYAFRNYYNKEDGLSVRCIKDKVIINKSENSESDLEKTPLSKETLEEAAENYANKWYESTGELSVFTAAVSKNSFKHGATWQAERSFTLEQIDELFFGDEEGYFDDFLDYRLGLTGSQGKNKITFKEWFEQIKKK